MGKRLTATTVAQHEVDGVIPSDSERLRELDAGVPGDRAVDPYIRELRDVLQCGYPKAIEAREQSGALGRWSL